MRTDRRLPLLIVVWLLTAWDAPGPGQAEAATNHPAVLFTRAYDPKVDYQVARSLDRDGFALRAIPQPVLLDRPLTWDEVKAFNVIEGAEFIARPTTSWYADGESRRLTERSTGCRRTCMP